MTRPSPFRFPSCLDFESSLYSMEKLEPRQLLTVIVGTNFAGIRFSDTAGYVPPDPIVAVGPNHVVEAVNANLAIYTKTGTRLSLRSLGTLFGSNSPIITDPQVSYDEYAQRFIVAALDLNQNTNTAFLDLAVSNSSDPTQGFSEVQHISTKESVAFLPQNSGKTFFSDFDRFGYKFDAYVFTFNMFTFPISETSQFDHVQILRIDKSTVLDRNSATLTKYVSDLTGASNSTLVPATLHGVAANNTTMFFVEEALNGSGLPTKNSIKIVGMNNALTNSPSFGTVTIPVPAYGTLADQSTPPAVQPGSARIATNDSRILNVVYRAGHLVASQVVGSPSSNPTVAHARWYDFDLRIFTGHTAPTLFQSGEIARGTIPTYYPAIDIAPNNDIGMVFMESASNEYMSIYATGRKPTDALGTMHVPFLIHSGAAAYSAFGDSSPYRAGDYSGISIDPSNGSFWVASEFATSRGGLQFLANWGTWIANFTIAANPLAKPQSTQPLGISSPLLDLDRADLLEMLA
ncbi:MAG TPA: hypothetical protein VL282_15800 [Tepidisphaeraceae bacterium]|nr:hypothetical protein [Tepidisphaeraceae bacterium]